ncbi:MAG: VOC family protein [Alphaproteobacteria bacterium]|nr:VOC family protein [Alphaproteobacteria bacterium]
MSFTPDNFTVWMEIPVTDLDRAMTFYNKVFNTALKKIDCEQNEFAMFPTPNDSGIAGHLYPGKPAVKGTGPTVHLASPDKLEDALERVKGAGGEVVSDVIAIPAGRFAYCLDPDGNSIGVFSK